MSPTLVFCVLWWIAVIVAMSFCVEHSANVLSKMHNHPKASNAECLILRIDVPTSYPPSPLWTTCSSDKWKGQSKAWVSVRPNQPPKPLYESFPRDIDASQFTWFGECEETVTNQLHWFNATVAQYQDQVTPCYTHNDRVYLLDTDADTDRNGWITSLVMSSIIMVVSVALCVCFTVLAIEYSTPQTEAEAEAGDASVPPPSVPPPSVPPSYATYDPANNIMCEWERRGRAWQSWSRSRSIDI